MSLFLNLIFDEVHIWKGSANKIMVSFEDTKTLQSFNTIDEVINNLYFNGKKDVANYVNKYKLK
tara:strand:+ start:277 stop:468 length:192 start_codon:yes stop_codon:yes gene_type:complete